MKKSAAILLLSSALTLTLAGCNASKSNTVDAQAKPPGDTVSTTADSQKPAASGQQTDSAKQQQPTADAPKLQLTEAPKAQIDYAFTHDKQQPEKVLINAIGQAKSKLDIAVHTLTNKDIVSAIVEAKKRGAAVRIITDQHESKNAAQSNELKLLKAAGIPIKENTHKGVMDLKITVVDQSVVTTGSFDYSVAAASANDEVLVVIHDSKVAQEWASEFEKLWKNKTNFQDLK